jgi:hypothetical protein
MMSTLKECWDYPFGFLTKELTNHVLHAISLEIMNIQTVHLRIGATTASPKWRFARVRDWSTLASFFPNQRINSIGQLYKACLGPSGDIHHGTVSELRGDVAETEERLRKLIPICAELVYKRRSDRLPVTHLVALYAMYWNLSSLKDSSTEVYQCKLRIINSHLRKGPVLLAETKWDLSHPMRVAQ